MNTVYLYNRAGAITLFRSRRNNRFRAGCHLNLTAKADMKIIYI